MLLSFQLSCQIIEEGLGTDHCFSYLFATNNQAILSSLLTVYKILK